MLVKLFVGMIIRYDDDKVVTFSVDGKHIFDPLFVSLSLYILLYMSVFCFMSYFLHHLVIIFH